MIIEFRQFHARILTLCQFAMGKNMLTVCVTKYTKSVMLDMDNTHI